MLSGPSPRIRGKWASITGSGAGGGTIPANTGKMCGVGHVGDLMRDHPREYGENP